MIELEKYKAGHTEKTLGYSYFVPAYINNIFGFAGHFR